MLGGNFLNHHHYKKRRPSDLGGAHLTSIVNEHCTFVVDGYHLTINRECWYHLMVIIIDGCYVTFVGRCQLL